jgi:hypothetical protein
VQVDPTKPKLKPPGIERLKLLCDQLLSSFAFRFNLRRYTMVGFAQPVEVGEQYQVVGRSAAAPRPDSAAGHGARPGSAAAGAYTHSLFCSTYAVLVTTPRLPLSDRLGKTSAPNVSHKMCLR